MANTKAQTKEEVQEMSKADRLWDSMNYTYGVQREDLAKQYQQAVSQANRGLMSRGMQRSSYGAQTVANLQHQGLEAQRNSYNTQIADYENRLQEVEQQDWQNAFQEKQFDEGVRQYNQNFTYQQGRDEVADRQWQLAFDQGNKDNDRNLAASYVNALIAKGQMPSDDLLNRAGLSREDAQRMLAQAAAAAGSPGPTKPGPGEDDKDKLTAGAASTAAKILAIANANGASTAPTGKTNIWAGYEPTPVKKPGSSTSLTGGIKRTEKDR